MKHRRLALSLGLELFRSEICHSTKTLGTGKKLACQKQTFRWQRQKPLNQSKPFRRKKTQQKVVPDILIPFHGNEENNGDDDIDDDDDDDDDDGNDDDAKIVDPNLNLIMSSR